MTQKVTWQLPRGVPMPIISFTKKELEDLPTTSSQYDVRDSKTNGLVLRVSPGGSKTFMFLRRIGGTLIRIKIGRFGDITIDIARQQIALLNSQMVNGVRPHEIFRARRQEMTFKMLFDKYYKEHTLVHNKNPQPIKATIEFHLLPKIGSTKIGNITRQQMKQIHLEQGLKRGKQEANKVLNLARAIYNFAIREELYDGKNPCVGIKRFKTKSRDRFLSKDELKRFFEALEQEETLFQHFFKTCLFTGARKSTVLKMRYGHINFDLQQWRVPDDETKNGEVNTYSLSEEVVQILQERKRKNDLSPCPSPFVFPGDGKDGHLKDPKKAFARIKKRMNAQDIRIHDLRRTLASYMAINNSSLPIIGQAMNHKSQVSTQIYARLSHDPVRDAVNEAVASMKQAT